MKRGLILVAIFFAIDVLSAGLAVKGSYRARGNSFRNLHLDSSMDTRYRNYIDNRFRLNAAFVANDLILIRSDIDFLGNCGEYSGSSFGCLLGYNTQDAQNINTSLTSSSSRNNFLLGRWVPSDSNSISARRMWAELNTKFGILIIGRQPDHWGLGIFANSGDELFDNYGDSLDRIQLAMKFGAVDFTPYYGLFSERSIDRTNDIYEMGFKVKYNMNDTKNVYGFYLDIRSSRDKNNRVSTYDLFAKHNFGVVNLGLELVFQNGKVEGNSIEANGILFNLSGDVAKWLKATAEVGFASGSDSETNPYKEFSFNPDFKPALILLSHEYGQPPFRLKGNDGSVTYHYPASVSNAVYFKQAFQAMHKNSIFDVSFIWAKRHQTDKRSDGKSLGYELDFSYSYRQNDNLFYGMDVAIFKPGAYYDLIDGVDKKLTFASLLGLKVGVTF